MTTFIIIVTLEVLIIGLPLMALFGSGSDNRDNSRGGGDWF